MVSPVPICAIASVLRGRRPDPAGVEPDPAGVDSDPILETNPGSTLENSLDLDPT